MSNTFQVIQGNDPANSDLLASMHSLRYDIFHKELKWTTGLNLIANMEYDEYDRLDTYYIIHTDEDGQVDATCRLLPTTSPYMISEHYSDFVDKIPLPQSNEIWEISRFCASEKARKESKGKITGQLIAASIEFGLANSIKNYVALATDTVIPVIRRFAGWDPTPIGERKKTPDDHAYSVIYTVSEEMLQKIKEKNGIEDSLLVSNAFASFIQYNQTEQSLFI